MRNFKKFLALVMATLMILSAAVITTGAADSKADYTEAAQHLVALKIMKGDEKGNLMLENGVTRYQAALFFAQTLSGETRVEVWNAEKTSTVFKDVTAYGTAIDYVQGAGIIAGRGNGVFGPNDAITYQDMLVMAIRALGYETADMKYPYGYILAAKKLNLTDNVEKVDFKAALTRGETSQIIWDMLNTKVAVVDPLSDKILYPDETGWTDALIGKDGKTIPRKTLLEQSGYASGKIDSMIIDFKAADKDNEFDVVTLAGGLKINAADLGITDKTPKISYMGLPVSLLIDCAEDDFEGKYNVDPDESKANVVYAEYEAYTTVENLGKAGNIRYDDKALTLNGAKFTAEKYDVALKIFNGTWADAKAEELNTFKKNFKYDAKDGYITDGANSYGKVAYRVIEGEKKDTIEVLYTPYTFGQYKVFTTKDATTSKNADFAAYSADFGKNYILFGTTNVKISDKTASVSRKNGEFAKAVTTEGEAVKSGDFMYYAYNGVDNILTVALNCGGFQTGRLTSVGSKGDTVKIGGTTYKLDASVKADKDYIGKTVEFLAVDGKIVNLSKASDEKTAAEGYDYAIISTDAETVASVLDLTKEQYEAALKAGVYVADKGVAVAVLNKTTGKWEVGYISGVASSYNKTKNVFNTTTDLASMASFMHMGVALDQDKKDAFVAGKAVLDTQDHIVAVVSEKDGAMVIANKIQKVGVQTVKVIEKDAEGNDQEVEKPVDITAKIVASGRGENGITLTSAAKVTSYISEITLDAVDANTAKTRRTYTDTTRFIAIGGDTGAVATRVGPYSNLGDSNKWIGTAATFYAASSDLFVFVLDKSNKENLETWGGKAATTTTDNYFMVMPNTTYEIEENADEKMVLVIKNLFDLKTLKTAADQTIDYTDDNLKLLENKAGTILKRNAKNVFTAPGDYTKLGYTIEKNDKNQNVIKAGLIDIYKAINGNIKTSLSPADNATKKHGLWTDGKYTAGNAICFDHFVMNGEFVGFGGTELANATYIKAKVITLDLTDLDTEKYDYSAAYLAGVKYTEEISKKYDYAAETEKGDLAFPISGDVVEDITAETEGVLNQMMADYNEATVTIPAVDDGKAPVTVNVHYYGAKTESAGVATMIVFRVITK